MRLFINHPLGFESRVQIEKRPVIWQQVLRFFFFFFWFFILGDEDAG